MSTLPMPRRIAMVFSALVALSASVVAAEPTVPFARILPDLQQRMVEPVIAWCHGSAPTQAARLEAARDAYARQFGIASARWLAAKHSDTLPLAPEDVRALQADAAAAGAQAQQEAAKYGAETYCSALAVRLEGMTVATITRQFLEFELRIAEHARQKSRRTP